MALKNYKELAEALDAGRGIFMPDGEIVTTKERLGEIHKGGTVAAKSEKSDADAQKSATDETKSGEQKPTEPAKDSGK